MEYIFVGAAKKLKWKKGDLDRVVKKASKYTNNFLRKLEDNEIIFSFSSPISSKVSPTLDKVGNAKKGYYDITLPYKMELDYLFGWDKYRKLLLKNGFKEKSLPFGRDALVKEFKGFKFVTYRTKRFIGLDEVIVFQTVITISPEVAHKEFKLSNETIYLHRDNSSKVIEKEINIPISFKPSKKSVKYKKPIYRKGTRVIVNNNSQYFLGTIVEITKKDYGIKLDRKKHIYKPPSNFKPKDLTRKQLITEIKNLKGPIEGLSKLNLKILLSMYIKLRKEKNKLMVKQVLFKVPKEKADEIIVALGIKEEYGSPIQERDVPKFVKTKKIDLKSFSKLKKIKVYKFMRGINYV